jgi:hypothetical protein
VPSEYALAGQRKGFKRYTTPDLGELVADYAAAQQQLEEARSGLLLVGGGGVVAAPEGAY